VTSTQCQKSHNGRKLSKLHLFVENMLFVHIIFGYQIGIIACCILYILWVGFDLETVDLIRLANEKVDLKSKKVGPSYLPYSFRTTPQNELL
jgi:hypothetical protein